MQKRLITEKTVYNFAIFSGIQYLILTVITMFLYPGGTHQNHETNGYTFGENFFSDIGRTVALDGTSNLLSAGIYFWAMLCVGASTILMFVILRYIFREKKWVRYLSLVMTTVGIFAGTGLVGIGCAPADLILDIHLFFVYWAFSFLLAALLLLMICIYNTERFPNKYAHVLLAVNLVLAGYVALLFYGPSPYESQQGLETQVVGQKIIVYLLIIALTLQAVGAKKVWAEMMAEKETPKMRRL